MSNPKLFRDEEPIAALASGSGAAAIALLRLSGHGCHELLQRCIAKRESTPWQERQLNLCRLTDPQTGELIDEPMAVFFYGPRSYTGQDAAELYLHGGPYIVQRVLTTLFQLGFRSADPGEFTRRAFLAGKMDLTTAEGIGELVTAASQQQWRAARQLASGRLHEAISELRLLLMEAMAWLEARIDFPDEAETSAVEMAEVHRRVAQVESALERLAQSYTQGRVASRGLMVALIGQPNAGKSTLLNTLLGSERAIVSAIAGTTRDYLEEPCLVAGRLLRLVDTAGIRSGGDDTIERLGIERSLALASQADVVLLLTPSDSTPGERAELERLEAKLLRASSERASERASSKAGEGCQQALVKVVTKSDLGLAEWASQVGSPWLAISCAANTGIAALRGALAQEVDRHVGGLTEEEPFITSARHQAALVEAQAAITRFMAGLAAGAYEEMLAFELQGAAKALAEIIGAVAADDILGVVFGSFCVGK